MFYSFFGEEQNRSESFNSENMSEQEFDFTTYPRKAYDQKRKHNPDALINFFDNWKRQDLENSVLTHLEEIKKFQ